MASSNIDPMEALQSGTAQDLAGAEAAQRAALCAAVADPCPETLAHLARAVDARDHLERTVARP